MQCAVDRLEEEGDLLNHLGRIGLVVNQSSVTSSYGQTLSVVFKVVRTLPHSSLAAVFGPQHGYGQTEQDNMKETADSFYTLPDGQEIPLYSLYSATREPLQEQLAGIDTLLVDLQDIGCRVYTYMLTLAGCLRSAAKFGKKVVVLDRANPLGLSFFNHANKNWSRVEGNLLDTKFMSFVGWYSLPMRHGLTMGELGNYFIECDGLNVDYKVIPVLNLTRSQNLSQFADHSWAMPSPNIPTWKSSYFFPSFVALEGTNVSEGRGTTVPFELIGAPWLNTKKCMEFISEHKHLISSSVNLDKVLHMRAHSFRPTFNKHMGNVCQGIYFCKGQDEHLNLFSLGMLFLYFCSLHHKDQFKWSLPGYEYNFEHLPIHLILGHDFWHGVFSEAHENCHNLEEALIRSGKEAESFAQKTQKYFIYD